MDDIEVMARGVAKQRAVRMAEACGVDPSRITDFTIDARDREDAQAAHAALEAADASAVRAGVVGGAAGFTEHCGV